MAAGQVGAVGNSQEFLPRVTGVKGGIMTFQADRGKETYNYDCLSFVSVSLSWSDLTAVSQRAG